MSPSGRFSAYLYGRCAFLWSRRTNIMVRLSGMMEFISSVESCRIKAKGAFDMSLSENMAAFFRAFMDRNHKSLARIQEDLDISRNSLYAYSRGEGNPTISTVEYIAKKLNVDPASIMLGVYDPDGEEISMGLLRTVRGVAELSEEDRRQFTELFMEMVRLWDKK